MFNKKRNFRDYSINALTIILIVTVAAILSIALYPLVKHRFLINESRVYQNTKYGYQLTIPNNFQGVSEFDGAKYRLSADWSGLIMGNEDLTLFIMAELGPHTITKVDFFVHHAGGSARESDPVTINGKQFRRFVNLDDKIEAYLYSDERKLILLKVPLANKIAQDIISSLHVF